MSREIKFRAWDKDQREMRAIQPNWSMSILKGDNQYEVMQFTGLKDKNGKEIYEGDIIAIPSTSARSRHEVKFRDGCFEISMVPLCNQARENEREVIGNIYENPKVTA